MAGRRWTHCSPPPPLACCTAPTAAYPIAFRVAATVASMPAVISEGSVEGSVEGSAERGPLVGPGAAAVQLTSRPAPTDSAKCVLKEERARVKIEVVPELSDRETSRIGSEGSRCWMFGFSARIRRSSHLERDGMYGGCERVASSL